MAFVLSHLFSRRKPSLRMKPRLDLLLSLPNFLTAFTIEEAINVNTILWNKKTFPLEFS